MAENYETPTKDTETKEEFDFGHTTTDTSAEGVEPNEETISEIDWNEITLRSTKQLDESRTFKYGRMNTIKKNEDLYMGIAEKQYKNPYSICFPYMAGYIDQLAAELDEAPAIIFEPTTEADYRSAEATTAIFEKVSRSRLPHAQWEIKDRFSKKLAIFSGVGILKFHTESVNGFKAILNNVDHYDFHCEPAGGAILENHLFCGEEGIFKTREEIEFGVEKGFYDEVQAQKLLSRTSSQQYKENASSYNQRMNRHKAMGLSPESHSYVGQDIFKMVEWYTTYKGCRYYVLFDEFSKIAIRIEKLRNIFSIIEPNDDALYPYEAWHTHEDPKVFWSKAPADDVRPIAEVINTLMNQQLYNRDKQNMGHRLYDPKLVKDVKSLGDWRVDGLTPVDTRNGSVPLSSSVYRLDVGNLNGTIETVEFLNTFTGQKTGSTPGSQGQAPSSQKVGIYYGEMQQISKRLSVHNRSYREAYASIGLRFRVGLFDNFGEDETIAVKIMGGKGIQWKDITKDDIKSIKDYDIIVEGGNESEMQRVQQNDRKAALLDKVATVNPKWKDMQRLKAAGYDEEEIKEAYSLVDPGLKELLSEAAQAEQDIVEGKTPPLNRGANAAFIQHIMNFADSLSMKDKRKESLIAIKLEMYAKAHATIAADNEHRNAMNMINEAKARTGELRAMAGQFSQDGGMQQPNQPMDMGGPVATPQEMSNDPVGAAISTGQNITDQITPNQGL